MHIGRADIKYVFYEVVLSVALHQLSNCLFERMCCTTLYYGVPRCCHIVVRCTAFLSHSGETQRK